MTIRDSVIASRCAEIERLFSAAGQWAKNDPQLGAHLAAYLSVLVIGAAEDSIEHLVQNRVSQSDAETRHYVSLVVAQRFRNPDYGSISGLLKEFSDNYRLQFASRIRHDGAESRALEDLLTNKNDLAHQGTYNLRMTVEEVHEKFLRVVIILEAIEQTMS